MHFVLLSVFDLLNNLFSMVDVGATGRIFSLPFDLNVFGLGLGMGGCVIPMLSSESLSSRELTCKENQKHSPIKILRLKKIRLTFLNRYLTYRFWRSLIPDSSRARGRTTFVTSNNGIKLNLQVGSLVIEVFL
jgi:hypothetical protein